MKYDGMVQEFSHIVLSLCIRPEIINLRVAITVHRKGYFAIVS